MLRQILGGCGLGVLAFFLASGFVAACGTTPVLIECQLAALRVLPEDPEMVTVYDAIDVVRRVKACRHAPDGGP